MIDVNAKWLSIGIAIGIGRTKQHWQVRMQNEELVLVIDEPSIGILTTKYCHWYWQNTATLTGVNAKWGRVLSQRQLGIHNKPLLALQFPCHILQVVTIQLHFLSTSYCSPPTKTTVDANNFDKPIMDLHSAGLILFNALHAAVYYAHLFIRCLYKVGASN